MFAAAALPSAVGLLAAVGFFRRGAGDRGIWVFLSALALAPACLAIVRMYAAE